MLCKPKKEEHIFFRCPSTKERLVSIGDRFPVPLAIIGRKIAVYLNDKLQFVALYGVAFVVDGIYHIIHIFFADIFRFGFYHNPDHRLCAGFPD